MSHPNSRERVPTAAASASTDTRPSAHRPQPPAPRPGRTPARSTPPWSPRAPWGVRVFETKQRKGLQFLAVTLGVLGGSQGTSSILSTDVNTSENTQRARPLLRAGPQGKPASAEPAEDTEGEHGGHISAGGSGGQTVSFSTAPSPGGHRTQAGPQLAAPGDGLRFGGLAGGRRVSPGPALSRLGPIVQQGALRPEPSGPAARPALRPAPALPPEPAARPDPHITHPFLGTEDPSPCRPGPPGHCVNGYSARESHFCAIKRNTASSLKRNAVDQVKHMKPRHRGEKLPDALGPWGAASPGLLRDHSRAVNPPPLRAAVRAAGPGHGRSPSASPGKEASGADEQLSHVLTSISGGVHLRPGRPSAAGPGLAPTR